MLQQVAITGHNQPPSDIDIVQYRLSVQEIEILESLDAITSTPVPEAIEDELVAGQVTERIKRIKGIRKQVEVAHKEVKAPYLECGRAVDGWKTKLEAQIEAHEKAATKPLDAFLAKKAQEERERRLAFAKQQQEEADRLAAEARKHQEAGIQDTAVELATASAQAEATANRVAISAVTKKSNELAKSYSSTGSTASQRVAWVGEVIDVAAIDLEKLRPFFTLAEIEKALKAFVRNGGRECAGALIEEKSTGLNIK